MKTKPRLNKHMLRFLLVGALAGTAGACVSGDIGTPDDEEDVTNSDSDEVIDTNQPLAAGLQLALGINGTACAASPFNCKFRASGGNRVMTQAGEESWGIAPGASVRDGNGNALTTQNSTTMTFNYGQTRLLAGKAHALGLSTSNGSAGWYPLDHIKGEASFRSQNGEVNGKDPGRAKMACYQIRNSHDASIELKKVVYDAQTAHERVGDNYHCRATTECGRRIWFLAYRGLHLAGLRRIIFKQVRSFNGWMCRPRVANRQLRFRRGSLMVKGRIKSVVVR